jgi:hypothetical protein
MIDELLRMILKPELSIQAVVALPIVRWGRDDAVHFKTNIDQSSQRLLDISIYYKRFLIRIVCIFEQSKVLKNFLRSSTRVKSPVCRSVFKAAIFVDGSASWRKGRASQARGSLFD